MALNHETDSDINSDYIVYNVWEQTNMYASSDDEL